MGTELLTETRRSNGWIGCVGEMATTSDGYTDQSYTSSIDQEYAAVIPMRPRAIAVVEPTAQPIINGVAIFDLSHPQIASVAETESVPATAPAPAKWWQLENL